MSGDFPEHWQLKSIEEAMDALIDYRGKTPKKTASGIPLITAKIVKNGRIHKPSNSYLRIIMIHGWFEDCQK